MRVDKLAGLSFLMFPEQAFPLRRVQRACLVDDRAERLLSRAASAVRVGVTGR
jgi:hypothetical protein